MFTLSEYLTFRVVCYKLNMLILLILSLAMATVHSSTVSLGSFRSRQHQLQGTVTILSERVIEITGFTYDGAAPAAYFWIDSSAVPSRNGMRLLDATPSNSCGMRALPRATGTTVIVEFPPEFSIQNYLGGSISVWCETFFANFGEVIIPTSLFGLTTTESGPKLLCSGPVEVSLGALPTRGHRVSGQIFALSERVLEIRGFVYDGAAPDVFFWADTNAIPTTGGFILSDSTPSNSCGNRPLPPADGSVTYRVEFPEGKSLRDILGGSISIWCRTFRANFGEVVIPLSLSVPTTAAGPAISCNSNSTVPTIAKTPNGFNCEPLNSQYQVRWAVMGNEIAVELVGLVSETDWMGFGISGSTTRTFMLGADPTVVDMYNGTYRARDYYLINRSQCSGVSGVCPDTRNGKTDDVKINSVSGERNQGITLVRYVRPLTPTDVNDNLPSDSRIDRSISVASGISTYIVWATGPVSPDTGLPQFHTAYPRGLDFKLEFGRTVKDNCVPLVANVEVTPPVPYQIPVLKNVTEIVARIGPSGGDRGYSAITNTVSWGIAWYMNDLLIPVIEMRRGTKYTFRISGGNTPTSNSEFHPLYFTTSASGGYAQMSSDERARQIILAGITVTQRDSNGNVVGYESPLQAPICQYQVSDATFLLPESATFQDYYNTLDRSCSQNSAITNAAMTFEFTPTKDTPDLIYYQCVTHRNLGWKINVLDAVSPPVSPPQRANPIATPSSLPVSAPVTIPSPVSEPNSFPLSTPVAIPVTAPFPVPVMGPLPAPLSATASPALQAPSSNVAPPQSPRVTPVPVQVPVPIASPTSQLPTATTVQPVQEESRCLLGLSFFCLIRQECGFFRRLFGLGSC